MNKMVVLGLAATCLNAFGAYEGIGLAPVQGYDGPSAKVEAVEVYSSKSNAAVSVYAVKTVECYTNAEVVVSETVTNVVVTPAYKGVYSRGLFNYTNVTGNAYANADADDMVRWNAYGTNGWYVVTNICNGASVTNVAFTTSTNTFSVGGKSYDWNLVKQTPSVSTNIVTSYVTNIVSALKSATQVTNKIVDVSCSGGYGKGIPASASFVTGGTKIVVDGIEVSGEAVNAKLIIFK